MKGKKKDARHFQVSDSSHSLPRFFEFVPTPKIIHFKDVKGLKIQKEWFFIKIDQFFRDFLNKINFTNGLIVMPAKPNFFQKY